MYNSTLIFPESRFVELAIYLLPEKKLHWNPISVRQTQSQIEESKLRMTIHVSVAGKKRKYEYYVKSKESLSELNAEMIQAAALSTSSGKHSSQ